MIVLTATTDNLQAVLAGSMTTNQPQCVTSWRDITTTDFTPGRTVINTNNTTDVNIVAAPAASTQRVVDLINIYNKDTVAATVTVKFDANGTEYILWKGSLAAGESVQYVEGKGWQRLGASGIPLTEPGDAYIPGGTDVAVADGGTGASTAAGARTNLGAAQAPLFGYSNGQSVTSATPTPITGLTVTVEDDKFYNVDIWIAIDTTSASFGEISTTGTAAFNGLLLARLHTAAGAEDARSRPASFTWAGDTNAEYLLHFTGTIQTTGAGTIILNALSINGPGDAFVIDEARMTLTPIGDV